LIQKPQAFGFQSGPEQAHAGDIAAGSIEACDDAGIDSLIEATIYSCLVAGPIASFDDSSLQWFEINT
jgi:hypothetical protein